jgi:uncharacterized integral membrane protein
LIINPHNTVGPDIMQFLRTAFWVILAMIIVLFSVTNWTPVTITLWGGNQLITRLPVLVIVAFLAGSLPFWALHRATRWRMRRKLDSAERALASVLPAQPAPPPVIVPVQPVAPAASVTPVTPVTYPPVDPDHP